MRTIPTILVVLTLFSVFGCSNKAARIERLKGEVLQLMEDSTKHSNDAMKIGLTENFGSEAYQAKLNELQMNAMRTASALEAKGKELQKLMGEEAYGAWILTATKAK